jgi:hypothetical protein
LKKFVAQETRKREMYGDRKYVRKREVYPKVRMIVNLKKMGLK